ncbi:MAG: putative toxin-antitoxin system toxin component, PIN family [Pirellulales bacterium]
MKIVLDTNVFVSGIFFGGAPEAILRAWQADKISLVVSVEILQEYERVCSELNAEFPDVDPSPFLELMALTADVVDCPPLLEPVCADSDDDKFLACALAAGSCRVVSGDKLLLATSGYHGIEVIRPRQFVELFLKPR